MKAFNELGVKSKTLSGEKIKLDDVIDKQIIVQDYRIAESKFGKRGSARCLHLQIKIDEQIRVVFTGSEVLMETLEQIPQEAFPFTTTIIKEKDWYKFT